MRTAEIHLLQEVMRETERALNAIDILSDKVYDTDLSLQLSRQSIKYSQIKNDAAEKLVENKAEGYRSSAVSRLAQNVDLNSRTLLNTSTGHVAKMLIQNSNNNIIELEKALRHSEERDGEAVHMAKQMIAFEEKNIRILKHYL